MRFIFVFLISFLLSWACQGDCASCHAKLDYKNDQRHIPMTECKSCHTDEKMAQIDMGGCGQDCFACHQSQKLLTPPLSQAHQVIRQCIDCHTKINPLDFKHPFQIKPNPSGPFPSKQLIP
ncbi:hypothetical protein [Helicobacter kayseriensis]|uniref:hypothetical protein n=1 Tax=Helicobacter kayseriensis TaxID=2905877 RepID=UPI001E2FA622|nr:hypothetical protein [Helicobacter kayseriensis]MCE3047729.1 hypothetical protein [Helicobacter kayseriensis]MCE3049120.1 hypothetical protein [Helicobacter kayseriensis]